MKRTWKDNPKKNPAARRKRPAEVVEMRRRGIGRKEKPTMGFRDKLGRFIMKYWYADTERKYKSRSKYHPH